VLISRLNAQVQLSTYVYEQLETTAFGDTARKFGAATPISLGNNSIEVELYQSYAAGETEATIFWFSWHHNQLLLLRQHQALHQPQTRSTH
jgi:hypothetical protein